MGTKVYTLDDINKFIFDGFNYILPEETLKIISEIAIEVGSPDYVKTPIFNKNKPKEEKENSGEPNFKLKKQRHRTNDVPFFQKTKIEEKVGFESQLDSVRGLLNKLTDVNGADIYNKLVQIIDQLIEENIEEKDMKQLSDTVFAVVSTKRFYSKMYADLYTNLLNRYVMIKNTFNDNFNKFSELFSYIEIGDPDADYDKFCEINEKNEKRKSLASFYLNLMYNKVVSFETILQITRDLVEKIFVLIREDNRKSEVDELTENVAILYKKDLYTGDDCKYELIQGFTIPQIVEQISKSKVKEYKSLTNKTIFKMCDLVDA
jgi:hypothetical protein